MKMKTMGAASAAIALVSLSACVTDSATREALQATLDSVQRIVDTLQDEIDEGRRKLDPEEGAGESVRASDAPFLVSSGTTAVDSTYGDRGYIESVASVYGDWGIAGFDGEFELFRAYLSGERRHHILSGEIQDTITFTYGGFPSPAVPLSGSAVWTGEVRAIHVSSEHFGYDIEANRTNSITGRPIQGDSRIEADFSARTVDVEFSALASGLHTWPNMDWTHLALASHGFGDETLTGTFYGLEHQGVAGIFDRDDLSGVFGAVRE